MAGDTVYGKIKESALFLQRFLASPRTIGSITPSSPALTRAMLENVRWDKIKTVVELGAGTGVFTKAIMKEARASSRLFVFEIDGELRRKLKNDTGLEIYEDATMMRQILTKQGIGKADLIISSIPYAVVPPEITGAVLRALRQCIEPEGLFIAYQYSLQMKKNFQEIFSAVETKFVALNIPPAFVYKCKGLKRK